MVKFTLTCELTNLTLLPLKDVVSLLKQVQERLSQKAILWNCQMMTYHSKMN